MIRMPRRCPTESVPNIGELAILEALKPDIAHACQPCKIHPVANHCVCSRIIAPLVKNLQRTARMRTERLVAMLNDIATFFAADPEPGVAARAVESHISRFWAPPMRQQMIDHYRLGGLGLTDVSKSALVLLIAEGAAAPALHANEDGTGSDAG
jgi:formate dehydrogenase subunit delta